MWEKSNNEKAPILGFLGWVLLLLVISNTISFILEPYYTIGVNGGAITPGYIIYVINGIFCTAAFLMALLYGLRNDSPWYLMILSYPVFIIGGGIEEIGYHGIFHFGSCQSADIMEIV